MLLSCQQVHKCPNPCIAKLNFHIWKWSSVLSNQICGVHNSKDEKKLIGSWNEMCELACNAMLEVHENSSMIFIGCGCESDKAAGGQHIEHFLVNQNDRHALLQTHGECCWGGGKLMRPLLKRRYYTNPEPTTSILPMKFTLSHSP